MFYKNILLNACKNQNNFVSLHQEKKQTTSQTPKSIRNYGL